MISKSFQILGLQPRISNFFSIARTTFLTVCQNDFGNKITFLLKLQFLISSRSQMLYGSHRWKWKQYNCAIDWSLLWGRSDTMFESSSQCCRRWLKNNFGWFWQTFCLESYTTFFQFPDTPTVAMTKQKKKTVAIKSNKLFWV